MRRRSLFWGILVILIGVLLLLDNLGILPPNIRIWALIWPAALILLGLWFLLGPRVWGGRQLENEQVAIPLESSRRAEVLVEHGAGRLEIGAANAPGELLSGSFLGGVEREVRRSGERISVRLRPDTDVPFVGFWGSSRGFDWRFGLNPDVDLDLTLKTGAGENQLNLSGLHATNVRLETGASSTDLVLPASAGFSRVEIHAGAARVNIRVPQNVAARIQVQSGLSGINVDLNRFPHSGAFYLSPDYDTAANRAEIHIETGVGSIDIR